MKTSRFALGSITLALVTVLAGTAASPAHAATKTRACLAGNWETAGCWSPTGVPLATDDVVLKEWSNALGSDTTFAASAGTRAVASITIDTAFNVNVQLVQSGGYLRTVVQTVGQFGKGQAVLNGGAAHVSTLVLGAQAGAAGRFTVTGGQLETDTVLVGNFGEGNMVQSGGSHSNRLLTLGRQGALGSTSSYQLSGGSLDSTGEVRIGRQGGAGGFSQTGGSFAAAVLNVGYDGVGRYDASGNADLSANKLVIGVTSAGNGSFTQSGGATSVGVGELIVGQGDKGTYALSSGTLSSQKVSVQTSTGAGFQQFGGNHLATLLNVAGTAAGKTAGYSLQGGILGTVTATIGSAQAGGGEFMHSGGVHVLRGTLTVAGNGRYLLSGSGLLDASAGAVVNQGSFEHTAGRMQGTLLNAGSFSYGSAGSAAPQFDGLLINQGSVVLNSDATFGNGLRNETAFPDLAAGHTLTLNGQGLDNRGSFSMSGGTLQGSGVQANLGSFSGWGRIAGSAAFVNKGSLVQQGGNLMLANGVANLNQGSWALQAGRQLQLSGAGTLLLNEGQLVLNGGSVNGAGGLQNTSSGVVSGGGNIAAAFTNAGTLALTAGEQLTLATGARNSGLIDMRSASALLSGGTLVNTGLVVGQGRIANSIDNSGGRIQAEAGVLALAGVLTGTGGVLTASAGGTLLLRVPLSNTGTVQLDGGTVDTAGQTLVNRALITGAGTLRSAAVSNLGQMEFTAGHSQVFGSVQNAAGAQIVVSGGGDTTFYDAVQANAGSELRVSSASRAVFFGMVTRASGAAFNGSGTYYFEGGYATAAMPTAAAVQGSVVLGAANVVDLRIGGAGHDQLQAAAALAFGGTLRLSWWDGFQAQAGQSFDLFDWGSASGQFSGLNLAAAPLAPGLRWDSSRLYVDGTLSVAAVPEPAVWMLMLAGVGGMLLRRRATV